MNILYKQGGISSAGRAGWLVSVLEQDTEPQLFPTMSKPREIPNLMQYNS